MVYANIVNLEFTMLYTSMSVVFCFAWAQNGETLTLTPEKQTLSTFKIRLKTFIFDKAYS